MSKSKPGKLAYADPYYHGVSDDKVPKPLRVEWHNNNSLKSAIERLLYGFAFVTFVATLDLITGLTTIRTTSLLLSGLVLTLATLAIWCFYSSLSRERDT